MSYLKRILIITIMPILLLCSCESKNNDEVEIDTSLGLMSEIKIENAIEVAQKVEDAILDAEYDEDHPPAEDIIKLVNETIFVPNIILNLDMKINLDRSYFIIDNEYSKIYAIDYFAKLFGPENEFVKYKNYEIGWIQSSVYEKIPEIDESEIDEQLTMSNYQFDKHNLITIWGFVQEKQKIYVNVILEMNEQTRIDSIMWVNNEKEMTKKLAEQIYEDFKGIPISDLKNNK